MILALILTVIMTFLGFGLLTRSLLVTQIAGSERWSTKAFYAADAGLAAAKARLTIRRTLPFTFQLTDLRGPLGNENRGQVTVNVSDMNSVGAPMPVVGTQVGGGQDPGSEPLYVMFYKGTSTARQAFTRTERVVSATMTLGPVPLAIPE
jgi:hypothetical protein